MDMQLLFSLSIYEVNYPANVIIFLKEGISFVNFEYANPINILGGLNSQWQADEYFGAKVNDID